MLSIFVSDRMRHVGISLISADTDTSFVFYDDDRIHAEDYKKVFIAKTAVNVTAGNQTIIHFDTKGKPQKPIGASYNPACQQAKKVHSG